MIEINTPEDLLEWLKTHPDEDLANQVVRTFFGYLLYDAPVKWLIKAVEKWINVEEKPFMLGIYDISDAYFDREDFE